MKKLIVAFRNFANALNVDRKTAAINGVKYRCFSVGIAVSVPAEKCYETNIFMKSYIQMCSKDSNNGSVGVLSVETATEDGDLQHFAIGAHGCLRIPYSRQDCAWFIHGSDPSYASIIIGTF
jgi:hypothetical protein